MVTVNHMNHDVAEVNGSNPQCYQALSSTRNNLGTRLPSMWSVVLVHIRYIVSISQHSACS